MRNVKRCLLTKFCLNAGSAAQVRLRIVNLILLFEVLESRVQRDFDSIVYVR